MVNILAFIAMILIVVPCYAQETTFQDVPSNHWACEAVDMVAKAGIMNGYPNGKFSGDQAVTRYELAVALAKMVEFIQGSEKPLLSDEKKVSIAPPKHWAKESIAYLKTEGFVPKKSSILTNSEKKITQEELAQALADVSAKLIELRVKPEDVE